MKAKEVMINDWVWEAATQRYVQIEARDFVGDGTFLLCNCKPIPLTAKILEKNGFKVSHGCYEFDCVRVIPATNQYIFTDIDHPVLSIHKAGQVQEVCIRCDYVHTFQHALRLCGLDGLADNFKI